MIYLHCAAEQILQPAPAPAEGMSLMILVPCHANVSGTCYGPPCGPAVYGYTMFGRENTGLSQPFEWPVQ